MEVELRTGELVPDAPPFRWRGVRLEIAVQNLAYAKDVTVYFSDGAVLAAQYRQPLEGDCELWVLERLLPDGHSTRQPYYRFAIRYGVDGRAYWDNNNGWDYELTPGRWRISHEHPAGE